MVEYRGAGGWVHTLMDMLLYIYTLEYSFYRTEYFDIFLFSVNLENDPSTVSTHDEGTGSTRTGDEVRYVHLEKLPGTN